MPPFAVSEPRGRAANVTPCPSEVAQLAERLTVNQNVVGSSPTLGARSPQRYPPRRLPGALLAPDPRLSEIDGRSATALVPPPVDPGLDGRHPLPVGPEALQRSHALPHGSDRGSRPRLLLRRQGGSRAVRADRGVARPPARDRRLPRRPHQDRGRPARG